MNILRKILYPFSLLYGEIVDIRNKAFDNGLINSATFDIPTIVVGNLNVGGTGKSPQIEYLIRLLHHDYRIAVLSRGYKRKSTGFQMADKNSTAEQIGDEPLQFYRKFKDIIVAVDANRVHGIQQIKKISPPVDLVLLDDAFQHRRVNAGFYILLTAYDNLYIDDMMLPSGELREKKKGAERANIIIVSKCPIELPEVDQSRIMKKLNPGFNQTVFYSSIDYHNSVISRKNKISITKLQEYDVLLVTGIANATPLVNYLESKKIQYRHLKYSDHHSFSIEDKKRIYEEFKRIETEKKIILTTEKDYVRTFSEDDDQVYYLPIKTKFLDSENDFNKLIYNYVQENRRNS